MHPGHWFFLDELWGTSNLIKTPYVAQSVRAQTQGNESPTNAVTESSTLAHADFFSVCTWGDRSASCGWLWNFPGTARLSLTIIL